MNDKLIPVDLVLKFIESNLHDEQVLDDYRGRMVEGVISTYTSVKELKSDFTELAEKWLSENSINY